MGGKDAVLAIVMSAALRNRNAIAAMQPEVVLLGTGDKLRFPHPALTRALSEARIGVEVMDIQAALGISQMKRLDQLVARRHALAANYDLLMKDLPVTTPWQHPDSYSGLHLYIVRVDPKALNATHHEVFERLRVAGIGVNLHYIPVYHHPYYARQGFNPSDFPEAEKYYVEAISLPMFPALTENQQREVVQRLTTPIGHQTIF